VRPLKFSGLMRLDPAGWPFIGGALLIALLAGAAVAWILAIPFVVLGLFFLFFFRLRPMPTPSCRRPTAR
jgi:hypothetical protein